MEKKMNNKGFSLVELIVVIAIMAVLVGVLAPQFIKYVEKSRQSTDIQNVDSVRTVIEAYYSDKDGTDLPESVVIDITDTSISCKAGTKGSETNDDTPLKDGGIQNNKLKSKEWNGKKVTMSYTPVDGIWTYTGETKIYTSKDASGKDTDKFVLKKASKSE